MTFIKKYIWYFVFGFLTLLAAFRPPGLDKDYYGYVNIFESSLNWLRVEPSFNLIKIFVINTFNDLTFLLLIYAVLGVFLKLFFIKKISNNFIVSFLSYLLIYFILLDVTQIRISAALTFIIISVYFLEVAENKLAAILFFIVAVSFHYTTMFFAVVFFLDNRNFKLSFFVVLPFIGLVLSPFSYHIFSFIISFFPEVFHIRYSSYVNKELAGINFFSLFIFSVVLFYYLSIVLIKFKEFSDPVFLLSTKMLGFGLFLFYFFGFLPVISHRVSEMFFVFLIFIFPWFIVASKEYKKYVATLIAIYLIGYFYFYGLVLLNF